MGSSKIISKSVYSHPSSTKTIYSGASSILGVPTRFKPGSEPGSNWSKPGSEPGSNPVLNPVELLFFVLKIGSKIWKNVPGCQPHINNHFLIPLDEGKWGSALTQCVF